MAKRVGDILVEEGVLTKEQLGNILKSQRESGQRLGDYLISEGLATEDDIISAVAKQLNIPKVNITEYNIDPEIVQTIPVSLARRLQVIPLFLVENRLTVAMADPLDFIAIDELRFHTGYDIIRVATTRTALQRAIDIYYPVEGNAPADKEERQETEQIEVLSIDGGGTTTGDLSDDVPAVRLVNLLIIKGVRQGASDIHIEPEKEQVRVRFRINGVMEEETVLLKQSQSSIISRIKVISGMDVSEKRLPQDGRFRYIIEDDEIDFRVSSLPTVFGEKIVIRILDKSNTNIKLDELGFSPKIIKRFREIIASPEGLILITGPTGSGKTTTLYSVLDELNSPEKSIVTVENPVEYNLPMVSQVQVNEKAGLNFAISLRAILRQNPNIVMIGEIRDSETAEIAIRASMTGHLVLSTLHTNDAPSAAIRLIDMGIERFLVASSLKAVLAQRLIRKLCPKCKVVDENPEPIAIETLKQYFGEDITLYKAKGCPNCNYTGFKGRLAIHELMIADANIREVMMEAASPVKMRRAALENGMMPLRLDGLFKVKAGLTTLEEVMKVTFKDKLEDEYIRDLTPENNREETVLTETIGN